VSFDVSFTGGEYLCLTTDATGELNSISASVLFERL
jgi:hypothetical protein